jgi:hypothetical protein
MGQSHWIFCCALHASDALLIELRLACLIGNFLADGGQLLADLEHAGLDPASRLVSVSKRETRLANARASLPASLSA